MSQDGGRLSWPALLVSLAINGLVWGGLALVYQRASRGSEDVALPRTPIVWLQPIASPPRDVPLHPRPRDSGARALPSKRSPATSTRLLDIAPSPAENVQADDDWHSAQRPVDAGKPGSQGPMFPADPLQLRRAQPFPPAITRLKIRLREARGLASIAQAKTCGVLLRQWEGMRLNAAIDRVPFGLDQPAGREVVWRTMQAEGCLD